MANKYISCNFSEKDEVKALGGKWDWVVKSWFIPDGVAIEKFEKWLNDRSGNQGVGGLYIDLVPSTCWYSNLRSILSKDDWDLIRNKVYKDAGNRCSICGGYGKYHPVEAHERWSFDWKSKSQVLSKVESLCPDCHQATHFGLAMVKGHEEVARKRLMYVNDWNEMDLDNHVEQAFEIWKKRNRIQDWSLDVTWLFNFISLSEETIKVINNIKNGQQERY